MSADEPPGDRPFAVEVTERPDGVVVVAPYGELDLSSAAELEQACTSPAAGGRLVLDLRRLTFMDSSGLRVLMALDLRSRAEEWELVVARSPGAVQRIMDMCHVDERIRMIADPDEVTGGPGSTKGS